MSKNSPSINDETYIWNERVKEEIEKIKSQNKVRDKNMISRVWQQNANQRDVSYQDLLLKEHTTTIKKTWIEVSLNDREDEGSDSSSGSSTDPSEKRCKVFNGENGNFQEVCKKVIPMVTPPPTMTTWTPILRNNKFSHTNKQSNIPYFGDEVFDKDRAFIEDLEKESDRIQTEDLLKNEEMSDDMFLDLVKALQLYVNAPIPQPCQSKKKTSNPMPTGTKKKMPLPFNQKKTNVVEGFIEKTKSNYSLPSIHVFEAIASHFPENSTTETLITRYLNLTASKDVVKSKTCWIASNSNPDGMSYDEARQLFRKRLCRRCFIHDCNLHKEDPIVDEPLSWKKKAEIPPFPKAPCGNNCFLHIPGISSTLPSGNSDDLQGNSAANSSLLAAVANSLDVIQEVADDGWTGPEKTLFRVLITTFPTDFCAVAKGVRTKNCQKVYKFSLQENKSSGRKESLTSSQQKDKTSFQGKTNPKKKNKQQVFKSHCGGDRQYSQPYRPCHHPGKPCDDDCFCRQAGNFCEKFCYCSPDCTNRFPGCSCKGSCTTNRCNCYLASRECDPDLCEACGASQYDFNLETCSCRNITLQKRMRKKLFVAPSEVAGWGCFVDEDVGKDEFIEEYVGEMISTEEADKRGKIYDKSNCSYLFTINDQFALDATRVGGKIRFANHSDQPNCKARIVMVNGDHRIGIYAGENLEKGEELFFDYGEEFHGKGINWK